MVILKTNPRKPEKRRVIKTFTLRQESLDELKKQLQAAGYKRGIEDINFSNLLSDLIMEYAEQLRKENKEDEE